MTTLLATTIPQPPVEEVMPKGPETFFNIFIFVPLGVAILVALRGLLKGRGPVLLFCLIGGLFAAIWEPLVDVLGMCFLKENGALGTFTVLDRTMPLYIVFVYPWYVGGLGYLASKLFARGVTMRNLFAIWAMDFAINIVLETPGITAKTYLYYGHQPFNLWGFPLWWGFVNPLMPMLAGAVIYKILPHLDQAWKLLAVIAVIPMADGAANGAAGWPVFAALNQQDVSFFWTYFAAFATLGLALFMVWLIGIAVARPAAEAGDESLFRKIMSLNSPEVSAAPVASARF
ncbi:hypothetical protein [Nocardia sp. NPDC059239]|uniref:hypothetical protein n=1 Tax=unclassified Nocardia TaxID=2637762 RepID=UPI0036CAA8F8